MKWHENLYLGKNVKRKEKRIRWKIEHGKYQYGIYLVVKGPSSKELLRIIPAAVLLQPSYPKDRLYVYGIAGSRGEALEIVQRMVEHIYKDTGGFEFRMGGSL